MYSSGTALPGNSVRRTPRTTTLEPIDTVAPPWQCARGRAGLGQRRDRVQDISATSPLPAGIVSPADKGAPPPRVHRYFPARVLLSAETA